MSLDHFSIFHDRRFHPSDRPYNDHVLPSPSSWSYSPRPSPDPSTSFPHHLPSSWNPSNYSPWSAPSVTYSPPPASPPPYVPINPTYRHSPFSLFNHSDYTSSSSRHPVSAIHSALPATIASSPSSAREHQNTLPSIPPNHKYDHLWGDGLYTIDDPETASNSERPASSVTTSPSARASSITSSASIPPVKLEPDDSAAADCFVMEFSAPTPAAQASTSLAPPTEVPLRATQASKAMRKMMGVFRLNPFSMHESTSQPTTTWTGEEAGPLEEEPQMFEFQLDLPGYERAASDPLQPQPASSYKSDGNIDDAGTWPECNEPPLHYSSASHAGWLGNDSPASYTLPSLRPYTPHPHLHSPSPSSLSPRRTPLDNPSSDYASSYTLPVPSSCATAIDNLPSISTMARRWPNTSLQHPFVI